MKCQFVKIEHTDGTVVFGCPGRCEDCPDSGETEEKPLPFKLLKPEEFKKANK